MKVMNRAFIMIFISIFVLDIILVHHHFEKSRPEESKMIFIPRIDAGTIKYEDLGRITLTISSANRHFCYRKGKYESCRDHPTKPHMVTLEECEHAADTLKKYNGEYLVAIWCEL